MAQNRVIAVKASGAVGAAGGNSSTYTNRDCRGITVFVKNTAGSGSSPTITVKLQENVTGAGWVDVAGATTAAIAAGTPGTTQFTVYPGMTVGSNTGVSRPLGRTWRLAWAIGGTATPTGTFSVDALLHA
jgi:Flp pilus assembly protein TadG